MAYKSCFGDDNYFSEQSRGCIRCKDFKECQERVNRKAYNGWGAQTSSVRRSLTATQTASNTTVTQRGRGPAVVRSIARESLYNFDRPVVPQLAKYMGYSVAEVCLEELLTLVNQSRTHYVEEVNSPITIEVAEDGASTIKVNKKG